MHQGGDAGGPRLCFKRKLDRDLLLGLGVTARDGGQLTEVATENELELAA